MTTPLEAAFPLNANWPAATVRSKLAEAMIAVFDTADLSGEDFSIQPYPAIAVYGADGDLELYAYDATDTTTADDGGITCIVVSGRRYIRSGEVIVQDGAISATTTAQPVSPSLGDTYIVPAAPSGDDWASQAKTIATYTARGWLFRQPRVGTVAYVTDSDSFYRYTTGGSWEQGLGNAALPDGSVTPKKLFDPFVIFKVEGQSNAPPGGTPTVGTTYQVGTSPTGDFTGHTNEIARWNDAWEFFTPTEGDIIVRKDDAARPYSYRSGAWEPTVPASGVQQIKRHAVSTTFNNVTGTIQRDGGTDMQSATGKWLRFTIVSLTCNGQDGSGVGGSHAYSLRLYADTASTAIATISSGSTSSAAGPSLSVTNVMILYQVPDGNTHNYNIGILRTSGSDTSRDFPITAEILIEELVII